MVIARVIAASVGYVARMVMGWELETDPEETKYLSKRNWLAKKDKIEVIKVAVI